MSNIYQSYAPIYEAIGQGAFAENLAHQLRGQLDPPPGRVLDLACGTGAAAMVFARAGYTVVGVDRSAPMLDLAREKAAREGLAITYVQADILQLEQRTENREQGANHESPSSLFSVLCSSFDLATCLYDSLNYLTGDDDLAMVCAGVGRLLRPGGRFVFDLNTEAEFLSWDESDQVVYDDRDYLVYNRLRYNPARRLASGRIVWFVREIDRWWRGEETHTERPWRDEEVLAALQAAGMQLVARRTPAGAAAGPTATRIVYEARRA